MSQRKRWKEVIKQTGRKVGHPERFKEALPALTWSLQAQLVLSRVGQRRRSGIVGLARRKSKAVTLGGRRRRRLHPRPRPIALTSSVPSLRRTSTDWSTSRAGRTPWNGAQDDLAPRPQPVRRPQVARDRHRPPRVRKAQAGSCSVCGKAFSLQASRHVASCSRSDALTGRCQRPMDSRHVQLFRSTSRRVRDLPSSACQRSR